MLWHAMPPEINTSRLMAGAGPAPMLQAAAGWEALAMSLQIQADDLAVSLRALGEAWTGRGSESSLAAALPMVAWLQTASALAQTRAARAAAQAAAYTQALGTTPSLPEIATNHITTAVLTATNFLGINMVPIAFNETDYFVRMWNQAAVAMDVYQAQTAANTIFENLEPMAAILAVGAGQAVDAVSTLTEVASAVSTLVGQLPVSQLASTMSQMQQFAQPLQQLSSATSTSPEGADAEQDALSDVGLLGASPLSNHPLAGGLGPSLGAGLMRAESLPGAGVTPTRTPVLAQLIDKPAQSAMAGSSTTGGLAPMGMAGQGAHGTVRPGLAVPAPYVGDADERHSDYGDDFEDDEW